MVSPVVRRLFDSLVGDDDGLRRLAAGEAKTLNETEVGALLGLLRQNIERHPDQTAAIDALVLLAEEKMEGAASTALGSIRVATAARLEPSVAYKIKTIAAVDERYAAEARSLIERLQSPANTGIAAAAETVLQEWGE